MADEIISRDDNRVTVLAGIKDDASEDILMLRVDPATGRLLTSATGVGSGDVVGPASAVDSNLAAFDSTTGKLIKDSGVATTDVVTAASTNTFTNKTFDANGTGNSISNVDWENDTITGTDGEIPTYDASGNPAYVATGTATHVLTSNGAGTAPTFQAAAGGGNVSNTGTPVDNQIAVWTDATTVEGTAGLTYDGSNFQLTGDIGSTGTRITKGWFTDLQVTNAIAGGITGNAATVTTNANLTGHVTSTGNATVLGSFTAGQLNTAVSDDTVALISDNLSVFAATTSAQLAGVLSDETGSGAAVFATSPTLVTPVLGTPTSGNLSNCTSYPTEISVDTTPQLGGELDAQANSIGFTMQTATGDGTTTVDWGNGNHIDFTFGAFNETFTFTAPTKPGVYTMSLLQDSTGSRTATWPGTVKWPAGTAPTLTTTATTGYDMVGFRYDGTNYYGIATLDFS